MTPSVDQLRVLVKIVEAGNLSRAADVLGMQPSNVSRTLAQMEAGLGVTLLERSTRSVSVTEIGRVIYERAVNILDTLDDTVLIAHRQNDEPRGLLRLTCGVEFGMAAMGAWVEDFLAQHPRIEIETEFATREIDLVHEGFDLAIRAGPLAPSGLSARKLGVFHYGLYAGPGYLADHPAPTHPAQLLTHKLVVFTGDVGQATWKLACNGQTEVIKPTRAARLRVNAGAAVKSAMLRQLGIGLLPNQVARDLVSQGLLNPVMPEWKPEALPIFAVYPRNRYLSPKVRAFIDFAVANFPVSD